MNEVPETSHLAFSWFWTRVDIQNLNSLHQSSYYLWNFRPKIRTVWF